MDKKRKDEIRTDVRSAIIYNIKEDLDGGELLMKSVWENCEGDVEYDVVKRELKAIIAAIKAMPL